MKAIPKTYDYYRIKKLTSEFQIEFDSLKEFTKYAEKSGIKNIFLLSADKDIPERFAMVANGGILFHNNCGFLTLEDFNNSIHNNYPDAELFYSGRELGFDRYEEYKMSVETGITDAGAYDLLKKDGYIEGFKQYETMLAQNKDGFFPPEITNAYELEKYKTAKKFDTIQEFINACEKGFELPSEYRESNGKNYHNYNDYKTGSANGFLFGKDYYLAIQKGIETIEEFNKYLSFVALNMPKSAFDEIIVITMVSKFTEGKKTSLNKIFDTLQEDKKVFAKEDGTMPNWFTNNLKTLPHLITFLKENELITKYGSFDDDGQYFQKKKLNDRTVVVDGANVSYGKAGASDTKPLWKNILIMVKFLVEKGFTDITVFTDASLKHRLADKEHVPEIQKLCKFQYTPSDKPADMYLITYVKQNHCLIVTNDKFRDWKVLDPWVAQNIDYYTLSYMINEEVVIMPEFQD